MSSEEILGTISAVHCLSREVVWEVQRFSHLPTGGLFVAYSTSFMFQGQEWKLGLWPNHKPQHILTYLMRKGPSVISPNQSWKFHLGLKRRDGVEQIIDCTSIRKEVKCETWACSVMSRKLTRSLLEKETNAFLNGGSLIIFARISAEGLPSLNEITTQTKEHGEEIADKIFLDEYFKSGSCDQSKAEPIPSLKVLAALSKDLKNLYLSQKDSDTTIKVGNAVFRVHKLILETRVPGISSMLSHSTLEACDPKAFDVFLQFVYSGDLENLTVDNVVGVYGIADTLKQSELKDACVRFMLFNLNVATVCDVLRTAVNSGESDLQKKATEFLVENAEEVFTLTEWERFMVENPAQAQNLIIDSLKYARRSKDSSESLLVLP